MVAPFFSVITAISNPDLTRLSDCLRSAKAPNSEHIIVFSGTTASKQFRSLNKLVRRFGAKLIVSDEGASVPECLNMGVEGSLGEFLVFLGPDDFLEHFWWNPILTSCSDADVIYSDSFQANSAGDPLRIERKPAWSRTRLIFQMYANRFLVVRKSIFTQIGGFRNAFEGAQDHDLALRLSKITARFKRVPFPLYSWREGESSSVGLLEREAIERKAGLRAARAYLEDFVPGCDVKEIENSRPIGFQAVFPARTSPVSVVVPTAFRRDASGVAWVERLLISLLPFLNSELGDEVVFVHGGEDDFGLIERTRSNSALKVVGVKDSSEFNFSKRSNMGFVMSSNDHVLLVNDDIEFGDKSTLDSLFGLLSLPDVGLVGGLLTFPDYSIQHGGHTFKDGHPFHYGYTSRSLDLGLLDLIVDHEVVGVTGALMFQLKSTWETVGGFTMSLPLSFNDMDYCQKIRSLGLSVIQANSVMAIHHESVTRVAIKEEWETSFIEQRWSDAMAADGYLSPYQ